MFNNLKIILLRIKVSSVSELLYRLKEFFFVRKLKKLIAGIKPLFTIPDIKINIEKLIIPDFTCSLTENDADAILNGHKHTLNLEQNEIDDFENRTKSIFFSDIRITNDIDIRCVWEAGRLQHLTELILFSKKKSIQSFVKKEILHWINGRSKKTAVALTSSLAPRLPRGQWLRPSGKPCYTTGSISRNCLS